MYSVNVSKLNGKIAEAGITREALADRLEISRSTFLRRLTGNSLRIRDIYGICEALKLTTEEAVDIFLAQ